MQPLSERERDKQSPSWFVSLSEGIFTLSVNTSRSTEPRVAWRPWCALAVLGGFCQSVSRSMLAHFNAVNRHCAVALCPAALHVKSNLVCILEKRLNSHSSSPSLHLAGSSLPTCDSGDAWLAAGLSGDLQPAGLQQVQAGAADALTSAQGPALL